MSKHTPGPWKIGMGIGQIYAGQKHIATCHYAGNPCVDSDESKANANLMHAAPELLERLKEAMTQLQMAGDCIESGRHDEALLHCRSLMRPKRAALAKAEGREQ